MFSFFQCAHIGLLGAFSSSYWQNKTEKWDLVINFCSAYFVKSFSLPHFSFDSSLRGYHCLFSRQEDFRDRDLFAKGYAVNQCWSWTQNKNLGSVFLMTQIIFKSLVADAIPFQKDYVGFTVFTFSISSPACFGSLEESPCSLWQPPSP